MKIFFSIFFSLAWFLTQGQVVPKSIVPIRGDTIELSKVGGSAELKIKNSTKDTTGVLVNIGGGRTRFMRSRKIDTSTIVIGLDTLSGFAGSGNGKIYKPGYAIEIRGPSIDSIYWDSTKLRILYVENTLRKKNDTTIIQNVSRTIAELRARAHYGDTTVYKSVINNIPSEWIYKPGDVTTPDDNFMNLRDGTKVISRYVFKSINPEWFAYGPIGDGLLHPLSEIFGSLAAAQAVYPFVDSLTDSQAWAALQACSDWIIAHPGSPRVMDIPAGNYKLTQPLIAYKWDGINYQFCTIEYLGQKTSGFAVSAYSTILTLTRGDLFGIGIQLGKDCRVSGLYISGVADGALTPSSQYAFYISNYATYMQGLCRDQPADPNVCLIIDPFRTLATLPPDGGYPGMSGMYRGGGSTGGSSKITVEDCRFFGTTVGVAAGINGYTFNVESCNFDRLSFGHMKLAFAVGQDQLKDNWVRNFIAWEYVHTCFDNQAYGSGFGNIPNVQGGCIAGFVKRLINFGDAGRYGVHMNGIFGEGLYEIGNVYSPIGSTFTNFEIDFATSIYGLPSPDTYGNLTNVSFKGGSLRLFDNSKKRLFFTGGNIHFDNVTFQQLPMTRVYNGGELASYVNCNLSIAVNRAGISSQLSPGSLNSVLTNLFDHTEDYSTYPYGFKQMIFHDHTPESSIPLASHVLTVDTITAIATFTTTTAKAKSLQINDYIITETSNNYGRIDSVSTATGYVRLKEVNRSMRSGTYNLYLNYVRKAEPVFIGDLGTGSATITNVDYGTGEPPYIGQRVESPYFGDIPLYGSASSGKFSAIITGVNLGANTVTMSSASTVTSTHVEFCAGYAETIVHDQQPPHGFYPKNSWYTHEELGPDKTYEFLYGGHAIPTGSQQAASWYLRARWKIDGDTVKWYNYNDGLWKTVSGGGGSTPSWDAVTAVGASSTAKIAVGGATDVNYFGKFYGSILIQGSGYQPPGGPTIILKNTTGGTGREFGFFSDDAGSFQIADKTGGYTTKLEISSTLTTQWQKNRYSSDLTFTDSKDLIAKKYVDDLTNFSSNFQGTGTSGSPRDLANTITLATAVTSPTVRGSTASGGNLLIQPTNHATKGRIYFGTIGTTYSVYDDINKRWGINIDTPLYTLHVAGAMFSNTSMEINTGGAGTKFDAAGFHTDFYNQALIMYTYTGGGVQNVDQLKLLSAGGVVHNRALVAKTTTYTATQDDDIITADATGGAFTVTVPSAITSKRPYTIKRLNSGANAVTIATVAGNIDGVATYTLSAQNKYVTIVPNGADYLIIANN